MPMHKVQQGECISSIALQNGFADFRTIWDHPENGDLKRRRPDPNILLASDQVFVPNKKLREEKAVTGAVHKFVLNRSLVFLKLVLQFDGVALANKPYSLQIGPQQRKGVTDGNGALKEPIDPDAASITLRLENPAIEWDLALGHLDPFTEVSGVQERLNNLGHRCGDVDGVVGARTRAALRQFQSRHGLKPTGAIDSSTEKVLRKTHDQI